MTRRDKRGRRIGFNWWREYNVDLWFCANAAWERECETVAIGYVTEMREFAEQNPRPTLREFLETNKGMGKGDVM